MSLKQFSELVDAAFVAHSELLVRSRALEPQLSKAAQLMLHCLQGGHKILFCGNGGSAADAQHLAAEFVGRFQRERKGYPALALHANTSTLTAVANDYGFEQTYAREIDAMGNSGDVLVAISTSGNSPNILAAAHAARAKGMMVIGMTGHSGGKLAHQCDALLNVPSDVTARTQEMHIFFGHILCEAVENGLSE